MERDTSTISGARPKVLVKRKEKGLGFSYFQHFSNPRTFDFQLQLFSDLSFFFLTKETFFSNFDFFFFSELERFFFFLNLGAFFFQTHGMGN